METDYNFDEELQTNVLDTELATIAKGIVNLESTMADIKSAVAACKKQMNDKMDFGNPGAVYQDAYVNVKTGHRKEVKADIVSWTSTLAAHQELKAILEPMLDGRNIYIRKVQNGEHGDKLVNFRLSDNDVIWHAFFREDGSVYITDSDKIDSPRNAEKYLTAKSVKWKKLCRLDE